MRKDVKFGLTVGGILIATLIVYVIVLSGGGLNNTAKQDGHTTVAIAPTDVTPSGSPDTPAPSAHVDTPAPAPSPMPAPLPAPAVMDNSAATRPAVVSDLRTDWDYHLTHGDTVSSMAEPQRTETPTIDRSASLPPHPMVVRADAHPPTIDNALPSLSAPADPPAGADLPANANVPLHQDSTTTQPSPMNGGDDALIGPMPAAKPAVTAAQRTHRITSGENLWTIAQAAYGDASYYTKIVAANPGLDPKHLKVGKVLVIPELSATEKHAAAPAADAGAQTAPFDPSVSYRVVSGDTLEKISRKLYGDPNLQDKLYDLNKTLIGDDPDRLKIDWVLKLPKAPTVSQSTASAH